MNATTRAARNSEANPRGPALLRAHMDSMDPRLTQTRLAIAIGRAYGKSLSQQAVNKWLRGESRPSLEVRLIIERLTGVPCREWLTENERVEETERRRRLSRLTRIK